MFATLGVLPPPDTFRRRVLRRRAKDTLTCSRVTLPNDFSFYHIQLTHEPDAPVPWDRIAQTAGAFRTRLLLPQGMTVGQGTDAASFVPRALPLRLLCNSSARMLERMQLPALQQRLCVFDPQGVLFDALDPFVPLVSQIRVVTDDLLAYGETAARFRREYGLSLLLTPDDADVSQSNLLIAADAADVPLMFEGVIFTNRPQPRMNATVLMPEPPTLPPDFDALCPPDVDPLQFAAAAYELCAADTLGDLWSPMKEQSTVNSF